MPTPLQTPISDNLMHFDWRATDALQRDQEQSKLLHEPKFRIITTDPMTGHYVENYKDHCCLLDGNMSIYFESEESCKAYQNLPFNHPSPQLPFLASNDDDRGG